MSEPKRSPSNLFESWGRCFHCVIELKDVAAWALDLDKLRNPRLGVRLDFGGKAKCTRLLGKLCNGNTRTELKAKVEQRLSTRGSEYDVVMIIAEGKENRTVVPLPCLGQSDGFEIVLP